MLYIWPPFLIVLAVYCLLEQRQRFWPATTLKIVLSAACAATALVAAAQLGTGYAWLIAIGLTCAVPADYFLQYITSNLPRYRLGILCFGAMHGCLLVAFFHAYNVGWLEWVIFAAMNLLLLAFQLSQKWNLGAAKFQLSLYTVLVTLMAAKALQIGLTFGCTPSLVLAAGGLCFFISDVFLGIWDYHDRRFIWLALNRIVYFVGQMLLACSLLLLR